VKDSAAFKNKEQFGATIVDFRFGEEARTFMEKVRHSPSNRTSVMFAISDSDAETGDAFKEGSNFDLRRPFSESSIDQTLGAAYGLILRAPSLFPLRGRGFMIRVRACTMRCRCHSSCRRSRFSPLGTQIFGTISGIRASSRSVRPCRRFDDRKHPVSRHKCCDQSRRFVGLCHCVTKAVVPQTLPWSRQ
jgi:hypothetical protein